MFLFVFEWIRHKLGKNSIDVPQRTRMWMARFIANSVHRYAYIRLKLWDVGSYCDTSIRLT